MPFEVLVALRFLREGKIQTILILSGIGVGVAVIVFLSALIGGLQESLIERTLGTQAHVVVRAPEDVVRPVTRSSPGLAVAPRVERPAQRLRSIVGWPQTLELLLDPSRRSAPPPPPSPAPPSLSGAWRTAPSPSAASNRRASGESSTWVPG